MGISVGCGDIYGAYLDCQWVDVTNIADGTYILVTRVNWDGSPDALGHYETTLDNNWAQACITLDRSSGTLAMTVNPDCEPYTDCTGQLYGNAVIDCNGICGGTSVRGDLNTNNIEEMEDAVLYVSGILGNDLTATPCNDLNADGDITVYDASLLASCINNGAAHPHPGNGLHNHCNFPQGVENPNDSAWLSIVFIDPIEHYFDVALRNPTDDINAFQFEVSGVMIQAVTPLTDPISYPSSIQGSIGNSTIVGISYQDSSIHKSIEAMPLVRIHYSVATADEICISNVVDIVNSSQQRLWKGIENGCVQPVGTKNIADAYAATVQPNPFTTSATLVYSNPQGESLTLTLTDMSGRKLRTYNNLRGEALVIEADDLPAGMYYYHLTGKLGNTSGKLVIE